MTTSVVTIERNTSNRHIAAAGNVTGEWATSNRYIITAKSVFI